MIVKVKKIYAPTNPHAHRLQVTTSNFNPNVKIGDLISFYATISPINGPQFPYSYDFARHAYFNQISGSAFSISNMWIVKPARETSIGNRIEKLRMRIFEILNQQLGSINGGIAAALMVGEQKSIQKDVLNHMRISGLSHILSVSGLHLSLVTIICMFVIRQLLSCSVYITQQYNTKKIAAFISLIISLGYLMISGVQVAAVRAFIMNALIILSILLDKQDNSKRAVFIAAFLILLFNPESIFQPSFQMSFSAVLALVAGYEVYTRTDDDVQAVPGMLGRIKLYLVGTLVSSLIASTATAIFVMYHFHSYSTYSVLANLIVAPVVSVLIMPSVVLAFCLMPFGMHKFVLYCMGFGISIMVKIAKYTSALPFANIILAPVSWHVPALFSAGLLWICIWERKWRLIGLIPMAAAFVMVIAEPFPQLILDAKYKAVIAKFDDGRLLRIGGPGRVSQFHKTQWITLLGGKDIETAKLDDSNACTLDAKNYSAAIKLRDASTEYRIVKKLASIEIMAANSDEKILVSDEDLARFGTYFVYVKAGKITLKHTKF